MDSVTSFKSMGYELDFDENKVVMVCRKTYFPMIFSMVFGGVLFICSVNSLVQLFLNLTAAAVIFCITVVFGLVFTFFFKTYRKRATQPIGDVPQRYVIDLKRRLLCDAENQKLAALEEIQFADGYSYMSRSHNVSIVLPSKKKIIVFAAYCAMSFKNDKALAVKQKLIDFVRQS